MIKYIELLKKYGVWIIMVVVAVIVFLKKKKSKPVDLDLSADNVLDDINVSATNMKQMYKDVALGVAHNLGTAYSFYDPRHWTENDQAVFDLLKDLTRNDFKAVSELYFKVYAVGNNLSADLARLLDKKLYEQLPIK